MNKLDQMWYLLVICYDFATAVIPFFRAVCMRIEMKAVFLTQG